MKTNLRKTGLTLLLGLLVWSGLTAYAYRANEPWLRHPASPVVGLSSAAVNAAEVLPKTEYGAAPAQSGGSYNLTQALISSGGGASANGNLNLNSALGQSLAGAASGGQYSVSGGFLGSTPVANCAALSIDPASLPAGSAGVPYSQSLSATGNTGAASFALSAGALPNGLQLSTGGLLAGTPVSAGTFNFTIAVSDTLNCQGTRGYTLAINAGAVAALVRLNPGFALTGGGGITLSLNGVNFTNGLVVRWNGADRPTSFISSTELRATIPASDLTGNGRASITIFNPSSGATTAALSFLVVNQLANVSAASFAGETLAQEAIAAAFGAQLATATQAATSVPLPTALGGTSLTVRDSLGTERPAPLFFVSAGQVNYQLPPGTAPGAALIYLNNSDNLLAAQTVQVANVAPGLFSANANGQGVPAAVIYRVTADNTQTVEPLARFDTALNRFVAVPIDLGPASDQVFLVLFGTGVRFRSALSAVSCAIGGASASVEFADRVGGLIGLDQLNVRLPRSLAGRGEVDVVLTVDGKNANTVRIAFK